MKFNPLQSGLKILGEAIRDATKDEVGTTAGRINLIGMIFALLVCLILGVTSVIEQLFAGLRSAIHNVDAPDTESPLPYFIFFCLWTFVCMSIGLLDRRSRQRAQRNE